MENQTEKLHIRIITPAAVIMDRHVKAITAPGIDGEVTILPHHTNYFTLLKEGVLKITEKQDHEFFSIGGGVLETDGHNVSILVTRVVGQAELDEKLTAAAIERAEKLLKESTDEAELKQANELLRRSLVDMKLIRRRRKV